MPSKTHYIELRPFIIRIRRFTDNGVVCSFPNSKLGRMKALTKLNRLLNEKDHIYHALMRVFNEEKRNKLKETFCIEKINPRTVLIGHLPE